MAITLSQQPTSPGMTNSDYLFTVTSNSSSEPQFQFIADLTHEWEARGAQCLSELTAKELVGTAVAILPKDVLVSLDQEASVRWVINAQPGLSTDQWLESHNLIQPTDNQDNTD